MTPPQPADSTALNAATAATMRALHDLAALADHDTRALADLGQMRDEVDALIGLAVTEHRTHPLPTSWATIGRMLGITRQSARERFSPPE